MDAFDPAARAEFTRRFEHFDGYRSEARQDDLFTVFKSGMQYASTQEPTDAETGQAYAEWMNHGPISDLDARRLNCTCGARGFTPSGYEHHRLRAALAAARNARMGH